MKNAPNLIGLCGYAQSGKDQTAALLAPEGYLRASFADGLRDLAYRTAPLITSPEILPTPLNRLVDMYGWETAKKIPAVREFLQNLGVAAREVIGPDVWVSALHARRKPGNRYVITDVRFPNEVEYVRSRGGILVRVQRPGYGPVNNHVSETAIDSVRPDAYLSNDGTIEDLRRNVLFLLSR